MYKKPLTLIILSTLLFGSNIKIEKEQSFLEEYLSKADSKIKYIENKLKIYSMHIDNYLTNSSGLDIEDINTYMHLQYSFQAIDSRDLENNLDLKIKLKLPKTKRKLSLVLESDEATENSYNKLENQNNIENNDNFNLGLQYNQALKKDFKFYARVGLKLHSNPDFFVKVKAIKDIEFDIVNLYLSQEFINYFNENTDSISTINFYKYLNHKMFIYNHNQYFINSKNDIAELYNSIGLKYRLKFNKYLKYQFSLSSNDDDTHLKLKEYEFQIQYRQYLKKWLYYDLIPKIIFDDRNDFSAKFGIRFNLGLVIGKYDYN